MLVPEIRYISETVELHVLDLVDLTPEIVEQIDQSLVQICEGDSESSLQLVKSNFLRFLESKDYRTRMGAVAEFFVHLYLRQTNLKQEFLFFNLEEGSIKKGFDGFFSNGAEEYLVESKSGLDSTTGISHRNKLKEAFDDISSVIAGDSKKSKNNPWKNAYNHASHIDVGSSRSIRKKIKELSDLFDNNQFKSASEFNIIPCSSIFITDKWNADISSAILGAEEHFFSGLKAKSLKAICITKASYDSFCNYLGGEL
ncbi:hypothetical protein MHM93_09255 [Pseudoalteromonas sp. MM17-2]|uniref:hypothetical protein n=1 Tax=Pseudoalteromonas sp. MM17-2 TaxID=2917753 RepID=UPI001EF5754E|nr:hypothetical protein [Pseudoalteromonas sp. MM17-2]MCG7544366.1 hypothetical protein [Pseudoalteromonas sp. MM17-2]